MITILPPEAWREFRGTPSTKGLNQTTHLAMIEGQSGQLHRCYVKLTPANWPTPLTESIAWIILNTLGLPRPEFAALLKVPIQKLANCMPLDQHWLGREYALGFCVSAVDGKGVDQGIRWLQTKRRKAVFKRPEIARLSAFDKWMENQDRHFGNLLIRNMGEHVPIDNELVLYSLLWPASKLTFAHNSLLDAASSILKPDEYKRFLVETAKSAEGHQDAFDKAETYIEELILKLIPDRQVATSLQESIKHFLINRSTVSWMQHQLGVIA